MSGFRNTTADIINHHTSEKAPTYVDETKDNSVLSRGEAESRFESTKMKSTDDAKSPQTPNLQFRLLYAYFQDMKREPLLTLNEEIAISTKITKYG